MYTDSRFYPSFDVSCVSPRTYLVPYCDSSPFVERPLGIISTAHLNPLPMKAVAFSLDVCGRLRSVLRSLPAKVKVSTGKVFTLEQSLATAPMLWFTLANLDGASPRLERASAGRGEQGGMRWDESSLRWSLESETVSGILGCFLLPCYK